MAQIAISEAIRELMEQAKADIGGAIPCRVRSYDASSGVATLTPVTQKHIVGTDGEDDRWESYPDIPDVPILHPRTANALIHMPVAENDYVLLIVCANDISNFRETGDIGPGNIGLSHSLSSAYAIPGAWHALNNIDVADTSAITIRRGSFTVTITDSEMRIDGDSDALALASSTESEFTQLRNLLATFASAIVPASDTIVGNAGTTLNSGLTALPASNVGSTKVRCGG
jgi:hypothetical protein